MSHDADDWLVIEVHRRFRHLAADQGEGVDLALVEALRDALLVRRLELSWALGAEGERMSDGAYVDSLDLPPAPLPAAAAARMAAARAAAPAVALDGGFGHRAWLDGDVLWLCLARERAGERAELWLSAAGAQAVTGAPDPGRMRALLPQLQRPRAALHDLLVTALALRRLERATAEREQARRLEALRRQVQTLVSSPEVPAQRRLRWGRRLADELAEVLEGSPAGTDARGTAVRVAESLARSLVQVVLVGDLSADKGSHEDPLIAVDGAVGRLGASAGLDGGAAARRLQHLCQMLEICAHGPGELPGDPLGVGPGPAGAPPDDAVADAELRLLTGWTWGHEVARRAAARRGRPGDEEELIGQDWEALRAFSEAWLPWVLRRWGSAPADPRADEAARVRNWLRLHFAAGLLAEDGSGAPLAERWRARAALALVLRESLRFKLHGGRPGYLAQPDAFSGALRLLVDRHAREQAGLSRDHDIPGHLALIGDPRHPRGYPFAAGHLQHVLELYIAGHFFGGLELHGAAPREDGQPCTLVELLAGRGGVSAGARAVRELRATFSLAALYHDLGVTLFPDLRGPVGVLARDDRELAQALDRLDGALEGAGRELVDQASAELVAFGVFDPVDEPRLSEWMDEQRAQGQPEHALTGAWALLRAARLVEDLSPEVLRAAARAVLLHGAVHELIDPERDPAAALLVLCDELFDWDPTEAGPAVGGLGPSLGSLAVGLGPRRSRAGALRFPQLRLEVEPAVGAPRLRCALRLPGPSAPWPEVELALVPADAGGPPPWRAWLSVAQNLQRVVPGAQGFAPRVRIRGAIPPLVGGAVDGTRGLLAQLCGLGRQAWRGRLRRWVDDAQVQVHDELDEELIVDALGRALARLDLRAAFPELSAEAERLLLELSHPRSRP